MEEKLEAVDCMILNCALAVRVRNEDIDDIMVSALEGGINYWCRKAEVKGGYLGEYASDQISRGGELILHDTEDIDAEDADCIIQYALFGDVIYG